MKKIAKIFAIGFAVLVIASMVFSACKKEEPIPEPEPTPEDTIEDPYADSTGIEISDSIMVIFGSNKWKTLKYTAYIDSEYTSTQAFTEWVNIEARYPKAPFPFFRLKILKEVGNHSAQMAIYSPGGDIVHTIPGRLIGDGKCGSLLYYENTELYQPDGTRTSDWWPLDLTTSVLEFDEYANTLTARVTGHMFNYKQWLDNSVNQHPINVADADTASLIISFGKLSIIHR